VRRRQGVVQHRPNHSESQWGARHGLTAFPARIQILPVCPRLVLFFGRTFHDPNTVIVTDLSIV
jgi:hypothetical protein